MDSQGSRAFTLVETLCVIAIVVVVVGISFPVFSYAKRSARESATVETLHQTWLALELYRQDSDSGALYTGSSSALGLPNVDGFYELLRTNHILWWRGDGLKGYGPVYYPYDSSDFISSGDTEASHRKFNTWMTYSQAHMQQSTLVADFNHTTNCGTLPQDPFCLYKGFGIRLDGSAEKSTAVGRVSDPNWWKP